MEMKLSIRALALCLLGMLVACGDSSSNNGYFSGSTYKEAMISTDFTLQDVAIVVQSSGDWRVWRCDNAETCNTDVAPALSDTGAGIFAIPNETGITTRKYYLFENENGRAIIADRFLPLEVLSNARELGGIKGANGKHVKYGKILRSEAMGNMRLGSMYDDNFLSAMGAKYVIDFRGASEKDGTPGHPLPDAPASVDKSTNLIEMPISPLLAPPASYTEAMYLEMYPTILLNPASGGQAAYKKVFETLMKNDGLVIYHCTSGKDRAGLASALILAALGVSEADIYEDYMATSKVAGGNPADVRPVWLMSGFAAVKEQHGSVENYIRDVLQVDIEALRAMYLY